MLVFVHGWGFDSDFWNPLISYIPKDQKITRVNLGFRGSKALELSDSDEPIVAIGHSLGFLWFNQQHNLRIRAQVSINGFTRFSQAKDWLHGIKESEIKLLQRQYTRNPESCWKQFFRRCSNHSSTYPSPQSTMNKATMLQGLDWLKDWDSRSAQQTIPRLALSARDDQIVPPTLSRASFADLPGCHWIEHPKGNHLLPIGEAEWCSERVLEFLQALPQ